MHIGIRLLELNQSEQVNVFERPANRENPNLNPIHSWWTRAHF